MRWLNDGYCISATLKPIQSSSQTMAELSTDVVSNIDDMFTDHRHLFF